MTDNPYESPGEVGAAPNSRPWSRILINLAVWFGIAALLLALFIPFTRGSSREAARRMACSTYLKQIALALRNYQDKHGALPPAYSVDANGKPLHSWRTLILPFLEQQGLYEKIDLTKPWDDPANSAAFAMSVSVYRCPSANVKSNHTTYLAITAVGGCFRASTPRLLSEIIDDHAETLMVIEVRPDQAVHWMSPIDADSAQLVQSFMSDSKTSHRGGAQAALVDGSVRFLSANISITVLKALISIDGNDHDAIGDGFH